MLVVLAVAALSAALYYARAFVARHLPALSTQGLSLFRIVWGLALLHVLPNLRNGIHDAPFPRADQRSDDHVVNLGLAHWLASHPGFVRAFGTITVVALIMFVFGAFARLAYAVAAIGFLFHGLASAMAQGLHDWGLPILAIVTLVVIPWGDGFGVDQLVRRLRGRPDPVRSSIYGLAIWLPGLWLGIAWLSAAETKIHHSGLAWITGGAVRYHFVQDAPHAATDWGLWIASHPWAAVLFSGAGVAFEATFVLHVFFRNAWIRLGFAAGAALFLGGLYAFQGIRWEAWWIILVALLPWEPAASALRRALPEHTLLIDGSCPRCRRSARVLYALDWFDRLTFVDANDDRARERIAPGLSKQAALEQMASVRSHRPPALGLDAYVSLSRAVPLLWLPGLVASIPLVHRYGERVYGRVAARRLRHCSAEDCEPGPVVQRRPSAIVPTLSATICVVIVAVVVQQIVVAGRAVEKEPLLSNYPMYSYTYPSRKAFDKEHSKTVDFGFHAYAPAALPAGAYPAGGARLLDGSEIPLLQVARREGLINIVTGRHEKRVSPTLIQSEPTRALVVTADVQGFDWHRGRFTIVKPDIVIGFFETETLRFVPLT